MSHLRRLRGTQRCSHAWLTQECVPHSKRFPFPYRIACPSWLFWAHIADRHSSEAPSRRYCMLPRLNIETKFTINIQSTSRHAFVFAQSTKLLLSLERNKQHNNLPKRLSILKFCSDIFYKSLQMLDLIIQYFSSLFLLCISSWWKFLFKMSLQPKENINKYTPESV